MKLLQFSGGLDSLACLELLRNEPGLHVLTVTTDGAYPERAEHLRRVAERHPHLTFHEVRGFRDVERWGQPVDVVPVKFTTFGTMTQGAPTRYQSYAECCARGIWAPMASATRALGATVVYRGQRLNDQHQAPIQDGHVEDGVTYKFPIGTWTRPEVIEFVKDRCPELIPAYYDGEPSSRDCWDCTAYLGDNQARIRHLPPEQKEHVVRILDQWRTDVINETRW